MSIRRIRGKERNKAGNIYCDFCRPDKVDAVYRLKGWFTGKGRACEEHYRDLLEVSEYNDMQEEHLTEADYQIWNREED